MTRAQFEAGRHYYEFDAAALADQERRNLADVTGEALAAAGVERVMLQTFLPRDVEMVALLGEVFLG